MKIGVGVGSGVGVDPVKFSSYTLKKTRSFIKRHGLFTF